MEFISTNNFNGRNGHKTVVIDKPIVQRIPVKKVTFDPASIQGYDLRITPGMSAEVSVEVK